MNELAKQTEYFNWLCDQVPSDFGYRTYSRLLKDLYLEEFTYTIDMDENRAIQGCSLRIEYAEEHCLGECWMAEFPCSLLEMMVALARISEERTMKDDSKGDRTGKWFWDMIASIGLMDMNDEDYDADFVHRKLRKLLDRDYCPNGQGGLFTIPNTGVDLRKVDIWYQAQWYFAYCLDQKPLQLINKRG